MTAPTFVDTNVLIYAADLDATSKRERARTVLRDLLARDEAVFSTQVLQEFYVVSTRKLGVEPAAARRQVELLSRAPLVEIRGLDVLAAIDLSRLHKVSLWDALIVRCAQVAGCKRVLSEDLQDGREFDGMRIVNPFA
ncbi:MAG: PIN domain-containing protein [Planctomycetes bacterium]|nr:PIN domain-containing protein [Planctomycetota bacterium]